MSSPALINGVSPILRKDHAQALEVWEASVRATHTFVTDVDIRDLRRIVRLGLAVYHDLYAVRDTTGQVVGFIAVDEEKIEMLFVHPDYRAYGAGKRLLQYAVEVLGATQVDVNEQNEQALGFYLHLGFKVMRRSEHDGTGRPYPILHLHLSAPPGDVPV